VVRPVKVRAELIPTIPAPARVVARNVVWAYGRATYAARPLPDFLIIGAQKAGTTALFSYLREHPAIAGPPWKEVSFFDRHYARGAAWYRGNFPNRLYLRRMQARAGGAPLGGGGGPGYPFHPVSPGPRAALVPQAPLVPLVRHP